MSRGKSTSRGKLKFASLEERHRGGMNLSRIYLETLLKSRENYSKCSSQMQHLFNVFFKLPTATSRHLTRLVRLSKNLKVTDIMKIDSFDKISVNYLVWLIDYLLTVNTIILEGTLIYPSVDLNIHGCIYVFDTWVYLFKSFSVAETRSIIPCCLPIGISIHDVHQFHFD